MDSLYALLVREACGFLDFLTGAVGWHLFHPLASVPFLQALTIACVVVARKEWLVLVAETLESLELRGAVSLAILIMTYIQRNNTDWVTTDEVFVCFLVIKTESKDSVQFLENP